MIITVYNTKGGVGKSPISALIAKELDYKILTNDDSINEDFISNIVEFQEKSISKEEIILLLILVVG